VATEEGEKLAKKEGLLYFEISAKTGQNINKMFYTAVACLPFFDNADIQNREVLAVELGKSFPYIEKQNKDGGEDVSVIDMMKGNHKLNIIDNLGGNEITDKPKGCKC
jgi:hypothetical protein